MIFSDLQQGIAALLNSDAYHAAPSAGSPTLPGCRVFWDGQMEDANGQPLQTALAIRDLLSSVGVAAVVTEPEITASDDNIFAIAAPSILYIENPTINRDPDKGTGKTAFQFAAKAWAILSNEQLCPWSQFIVEAMVPATVNQDHLLAWEIKINCRTMLDTVLSELANEFDAVLTDESGKALILSPTEP